jgi:hypothetical protein
MYILFVSTYQQAEQFNSSNNNIHLKNSMYLFERFLLSQSSNWRNSPTAPEYGAPLLHYEQSFRSTNAFPVPLKRNNTGQITAFRCAAALCLSASTEPRCRLTCITAPFYTSARGPPLDTILSATLHPAPQLTHTVLQNYTHQLSLRYK